LVGRVFGDIYLHAPRGSNNRLNEATKQRQNANRLFDSQNNNNGGYNVADSGSNAATSMDEQHQEVYFQSGRKGKSFMTLEWFNQHGCGKRDNLDTNAIDCHMIIQYKCEAVDKEQAMRNGMSTDRSEYRQPPNPFNSENYEEKQNRYNNNEEVNVGDNDGDVRGRHETWENYDSCRVRERNKNLFIADQAVGDRAINTRQNPKGNRSGYECPEERDYFPYWHPTEWTDVAVLTDNTQNCKYYKKESSNRKAKGECVEYYDSGIVKHASEYNNRLDCQNGGGQWLEFWDYLSIINGVDNENDCNRIGLPTVDVYKPYLSRTRRRIPYDESDTKFPYFVNKNDDVVWGYPRRVGKERHELPVKKCLRLHPALECKQSPWSRANHLGNSDTNDFAQYRWELPKFEEEKQCVLRVRYNISSDDYPENYDAGDIRPYFDDQYLTNDPTIQVAGGDELALAINTAQIARTFQDRSHSFLLVPRPEVIDQDADIENIQVRGKRGNIVQTFPAVEYDFSPQRATVDTDTLVHVQWAGSNSNPENNAGEGKAGTDRNNIVTVEHPNYNIPHGILENDDKLSSTTSMFADVTWIWSASADGNLDLTKTENLEIQMATAGYYDCVDGCTNSPDNAGIDVLQNQLNNAPASFRGNIFKFNKAGNVHHFLSTRNNNFSNRAQKGDITVKFPTKPIKPIKPIKPFKPIKPMRPFKFPNNNFQIRPMPINSG